MKPLPNPSASGNRLHMAVTVAQLKPTVRAAAVVLCVLLPVVLYAQDSVLDDLHTEIMSLCRQERYSEATAAAEQALVIVEQNFGQDHHAIPTLLNTLAEVHKAQGNHGDAELLMLKALAITQNMYGRINPNVVICLNNLARLYKDQGNYSEAVEYAKRAFAIGEKIFGRDHPGIATFLNNLAVMYYLEGKHDEAENLYKRVIALLKKTSGANYSELAIALSNLAHLYQDRGKYEDAEQLGKQALEIGERTLGKDHIDVAASLNNLASLYYLWGKYAEAESLFKRALTITERGRGVNHPDVATMVDNLATLAETRGRFTEAERLCKHALDIREKVLGSTHPDLATSFNNLAGLYNLQGKYDEAESLYTRALEITKKVQGENHPNTAIHLNNLAYLYRSRGKYSEAEGLYGKSLEILEKAQGRDQTYLADSLNNLAALYMEMGKYSEAESLYQSALTIWEKALGANHIKVASFCNNLAELYRFQEKNNLSEPLCRRAHAITEKALGKDHPEIAVSLNNLAALYFMQGKFDEAEPHYKSIVRILKKALGEDHPRTVLSFNNLASLYKAQGRYNDALPLYQKVFDLTKKAPEKDHLTIAYYCANLAELHKTRGEYEPAVEHYLKGMIALEQASTAAGGEAYSEELRRMQTGDCTGLLESLYHLKANQPGKATPYLRESFKVMEISRSRQFLSELSRSSATRLGGLSDEDRYRSEKINFEIKALAKEQQKEKMKPADELNKELLSNLERSLGVLREQQRVLDKEFEKKYPKFMDLRQPRPIDVAEVQNDLLQPGEMMLSYWIGDEYLYACLIGKDTFLFKAHPIKKRKLAFKINSFRNAIQQKLGASTFRKVSASLYGEVMAPFIKGLDLSAITTLYIVPHGALATIPFEALLTEDVKYFFTKVPICYVPSAMVLRAIRQDDSLKQHLGQSRNPALLFGDPVYTDEQAEEEMNKSGDRSRSVALNSGVNDTVQTLLGQDGSIENSATRALNIDDDGRVSLTPLPGSRREVESISDLFYGTGRAVRDSPYTDTGDSKNESHLHAGAAARESLIKRLSKENKLKNYRYVHLAVHGILAGEMKGLAESCVALSIYGDETEDGFLKMSEIFGLDMAADMVTLSACQTALEENITEAQGISGLARAFFYAGTQRMTVTLWSVSDVGTCEFMRHYYTNLQKPDGKVSTVEALNKARMAMLASEYKHPFYWAPFILLGERR